MLNVISFSPVVTKKIGATIADQVASHFNSANGPIFILLEGNLGAGKTTFTLGFLKYFGIKPAAASPTFVIAKHYKIIQKSKGKSQNLKSKLKSVRDLINNIYHIDAYRLRSKEDLKTIGFNEIKKQPRTVVLMEWPGNVKGMGVKNVIRVRFEHGKKVNERTISIRS